MTRHEFVFDDLGNFNYSATPCELMKCPKMDQRADTAADDKRGYLEIVEDGDGCVSVFADDAWTRREVEYMLLDFYNQKARKLVEHLSLLDRKERV